MIDELNKEVKVLMWVCVVLGGKRRRKRKKKREEKVAICVCACGQGQTVQKNLVFVFDMIYLSKSKYIILTKLKC